MNRAPKPCTCKLARHQHGTKSGYQQCGCRCYPCNNAYLRADRRRKHGITEPRRAASIPATGTRRRLEALHVAGWSDNEIAKRLDTTFQHVHKLRTALDRVQPATAERVARLCGELWDKPAEGVHAGKVQRVAARKGFLPLLAWDDIDTDPEPPAPDDDPVIDHVLVDRIIAGTTRLPKGSRAPERAVAVRRLAAYGLTDAEIARRVGITQWNAQKVRERNGIEPARPSGRAA